MNWMSLYRRRRKDLEPLHAIYRRNTCLPVVDKAIHSGEQRLISWFPDVKVRILTKDETRPFDALGLSFLNVNTPEELLAAEKLDGIPRTNSDRLKKAEI